MTWPISEELKYLVILAVSLVAMLFWLKPWLKFGGSPLSREQQAVNIVGECGFKCLRLMEEEIGREAALDVAYVSGEAEAPGASELEVFLRVAEIHHPDGYEHKHTPEEAVRTVRCYECDRTALWIGTCFNGRCSECCQEFCRAHMGATT